MSSNFIDETPQFYGLFFCFCLCFFFFFFFVLFFCCCCFNYFFLIFEVLISISDRLVAGLSVIYFETFHRKVNSHLKPFSERDKDSCDKILESIRRALNGFKFRQVKNRVRVLTGLEEGTFGWITANLVNNALNLKVVSLFE